MGSVVKLTQSLFYIVSGGPKGGPLKALAHAIQTGIEQSAMFLEMLVSF